MTVGLSSRHPLAVQVRVGRSSLSTSGGDSRVAAGRAAAHAWGLCREGHVMKAASEAGTQRRAADGSAMTRLDRSLASTMTTAVGSRGGERSAGEVTSILRCGRAAW